MQDSSPLRYKCYALCVGINTYAPSSKLNALQFAENDARAMNEVFGALGFDQDDRVLLLGEQATLPAINESLNKMMDRAEENDLVVFYFAGHGEPLYFEKDGTHDVFLASYDFDPQELERRRTLRTQSALGMERLRRDYFEGQGSRKRLFVFDSCYSGEFAGSRSGSEQSILQYMHTMLDCTSSGRVALLSCLPEQVARETSKHCHGWFTYYLLQALGGKAQEAVRWDGWLTVNSLFDYLDHCLPERQRPVFSGRQFGGFKIAYYADLVRPSLESQNVPSRKPATSEKEAYVRAMLADHTDFLRNRLESFVGREQELKEIRQSIHEKVPTGGYVIITGQAGQGKSSIMAKLIDEYGIGQVPFHFIPFNPGPDHQVGLLRNLMARLILKYQLSEVYVTAENRATLRDYFPNVLREVAAKRGQEVIFIDGLDQIEEDMNGFRDLSFLPTKPPAGIVFVLATRRDDTLRPLVLLKPYEQYQLPNLRREDFDLILQHRNVSLESHVADQFYQAMDENALYLDLVAKELLENTSLSPQEMIARIANNPDNIFTLAITRFKRQPLEWREVIKPILGVLLAAREPLASWYLQHILDLDGDRLRDGITRLGGLLRESGQHCYSLFHLKLQEYLRQDERRPEKDFVFTTDDEEQWHDMFVKWCEQGSFTHMWEDTQNTREQGRREYARYHYIEHLYVARQYEKLFWILDDGVYGKEKEKYDRTNRSYIQDLDLGRRAAINYGKEINDETAALPLLWKYTLLRGSLRSQADGYPESLFQAMLLLHRERDVLGLVELITKDDLRVNVLIMLGLHYMRNAMVHEYIQIFLRAEAIAREIEDTSERDGTLLNIARGLVQGGQWERAEVVVRGIESDFFQVFALCDIVKALAQGGQWERAEVVLKNTETIARGIRSDFLRASALCAIAEKLAQNEQWGRAEAILENAEMVARRIENASSRAIALCTIMEVLAKGGQWERAEVILKDAEVAVKGDKDSVSRGRVLRDIANVLVLEGQWERAEEVARGIEDAFDQSWALHGIAEALAQREQWERAEEVARGIEDASERVRALLDIAEALVQKGQWERSEVILKDAEVVARGIKNASSLARALSTIVKVLTKREQWERAEVMLKEAEAVVREIKDSFERAKALYDIVEVLTKGGQWERAEAVLKEAETVAREIEDAFARAMALCDIANVLELGGQWERAEAVLKEAETVARGIENASLRTRVLCDIAKMLIQRGQWERAEVVLKEAETVARGIENASTQAMALREVLEVSVQGKQWTRSEAIAKGFVGSFFQRWALSDITKGLIQEGQWERAKSVTREIRNVSERTSVLCDIAKMLIQRGQWERAEVVLKEAETVARGIENASLRTRILCDIAEMLIQRGHWERAEVMLKEAETVAREIRNVSERTSVLCDIAEMLMQRGHWERAEVMLKEAETVARGVEDASLRTRILCDIAEMLMQRGQWERAEAMLKEEDVSTQAMALRNIIAALIRGEQWERAEVIARRIEDVYLRASVLGDIALALVRGGEWERAEVIARGIENVSTRTRVLCDIAEVLIQHGRWGRAEAIARDIEDASEQVKVLRNIAEVFVQGQDWNLLVGLIQRSWLLAETREYAFQILPLIHGLVKNNAQLEANIIEIFAQIDAFLQK